MYIMSNTIEHRVIIAVKQSGSGSISLPLRQPYASNPLRQTYASNREVDLTEKYEVIDLARNIFICCTFGKLMLPENERKYAV